MRSYSTAQRLKEIMDMHNLRQVDILTAAAPHCQKHNVKLGKNALSQYVKGTVEPGQEKLTILGLALGVSEAWLMGYNVPMKTTTKPVTENDDRLSEKKRTLINAIVNMDDSDIDVITAAADALIARREK